MTIKDIKKNAASWRETIFWIIKQKKSQIKVVHLREKNEYTLRQKKSEILCD